MEKPFPVLKAKDSGGRLTSSTTPAGVTTTYTYDLRDRLLTTDWSDATPDISSTYDAAGRLVTQTTTGIVTQSYTYNLANELLSESSAPAAWGTATLTVGYAYDADGRRSQLSYPSGSVVGYDYTARGQMKTVSLDGMIRRDR